ncbi:MAG: acyltransferase [Candidatus Melainabacteria bacterium]|nr:acyltransferase [Candidatus Melainabacteria bacterium]
MTSSGGESKSKIDTLTSLRFFAAAAIVVYHSRGHFGIPVEFLSPFVLDQGVSFFFVLSGFILSLVYGEKLKEGGRSTSSRLAGILAFIVARFARIWPLHVATLVLVAFLLPEKWNHDLSPVNLFASLCLMQSWIPINDVSFAFNGVSWSLSAELFFYLSFPFLILGYEKNWLRNSLLALCLMASLACLCATMGFPELVGSSVSMHELMYVSPLSRVFEFSLGIGAFALARRWHINLRGGESAAGTKAFKLRLLFTVMEVAVLLIGLFVAYRSTRISSFLAGAMDSLLPGLKAPLNLWLMHGGSVALVFALMIIVFSFGRGFLSKILSWPLLVYLGEISFSVYLSHRLLLHYYYNHFATVDGAMPIAVYWLVLLSVSHLLYVFVECPCRSLIVGLFRRFQKGATPEGVSSSLSQILPQFRLSLLNRSFLAAEALFLLALPVLLFSGPALARLDGSQLTPTVLDSVSRPLARLGDDVELLSVVGRDDVGGKRKVILTWRALRHQKLNGFVTLHLYTADNVYYKRRDYKRAWREEEVASGQIWRDEVLLNREETATTSHVHVGIWGLGHDLTTLKVTVPEGSGAVAAQSETVSVAVVSEKVKTEAAAGKSRDLAERSSERGIEL